MTPATATSKYIESLSILSPPPKKVFSEMKMSENIFASPKPKQPKRDLPSLSIVEHLLHYFSYKIAVICNSIDPKDINRKETINTSIHYFNRFYLKYSLFDYDPKFALLGCISLASKITEDTIKLNDLIKMINRIFPHELSVVNSFPKEYSSPNILSLVYMAQLHISEGINFDYYIYSPYSVLRILLEKLKEKNRIIYIIFSFFYIYIANNMELRQNTNLKVECQKIINDIEIYDNIIFIFSPSDIAIASLKYTLIKLKIMKEEDVEKFVKDEINLYQNSIEINNNIDKLMKIIEDNCKNSNSSVLFDENKMKDILNDYYDCTRIILNPTTYLFTIGLFLFIYLFYCYIEEEIKSKN